MITRGLQDSNLVWSALPLPSCCFGLRAGCWVFEVSGPEDYITWTVLGPGISQVKKQIELLVGVEGPFHADCGTATLVEPL